MLLLKILIVTCCALAASILYRLGGSAKTGRWYDFIINTKARDFGVPVCSTAALITLCWGHPVTSAHPIKFGLALFLSFGLLFGSLTTYWKKKGTDAKWWNWLLTGLGYGLAYLPVALFFADWWGFAIRVVILAAAIMIWSLAVGKDWLEEGGRGLLIIITLPLLLIGLKKKEKKP